MVGLNEVSILVGLTFVVAGAVKGMAGMGLPTVAMGLLGLIMPPAEAAALIIIPSFVTNAWQFVSGPRARILLRRIWPMLAAIAVATWAGAGLLTGGNVARATLALGVVLAAYGALGLARFRFAVPSRFETWLSPLVGVATGAVTGATGVFVIPAVPYLQALDLEKEHLVQALGLSFTVSTIALALGLATRGAFRLDAGAGSLFCTVPALAGMFFGQRVRARVDEAAFRRIFFGGLVALGGDLALRSLI